MILVSLRKEVVQSKMVKSSNSDETKREVIDC